MVSTILLTFLSFWVILLPVYIWWYLTTLILWYEWNRLRFGIWLIVGGCSVGILFLLEKLSDTTLLVTGGIFASLLICIFGWVMILTQYGSSFARSFLRRIAFWHIVILGLLLSGILWCAHMFPGYIFFAGTAFVFLLSSFFEETSKHLVSIGLAGQDFRFSRWDILMFTLVSVLGFVFSENLIYLMGWDASLGQWLYRSIFSLIAHIIASSFCAYYWWKALSYKLFSLRYIVFFIVWFMLASGTHLLYNWLLSEGYIVWIIMYVVVWYMMLVSFFSRN